MNLARVLFCVSILLTFPLECFVSREVMYNYCQAAVLVAGINSFVLQIIKTQIKRFYSHELVEYDKNVDPRAKEDSDDKVISHYTCSVGLWVMMSLFLSLAHTGPDCYTLHCFLSIFHLADQRVLGTHLGIKRKLKAAIHNSLLSFRLAHSHTLR